MSSPSPKLSLEGQWPEKLGFLFEPHTYKVAYGGRMGTKSWGFARALLVQAAQRKLRVLCTRETQASIRESVHQVLSEQIKLLGLSDHYEVQQSTIKGRVTGSEFVFAGLRQNGNNIKSYEDFDIVWIEEAQNVTKRSLDDLVPTVLRKADAEIWITFNPEFEDDEVYKRFVATEPHNAVVEKISYHDNPWLSETALKEIADTRRRSEDDYQHIYEGALRQTVEGAIYKRELFTAESDGRITRVPYDSQWPVSTFWDIGPAHTAVWFAQAAGFEYRVVDFLQGELQGLSHYMKSLQEKPYVYGTHWLPWDGEAKELGSGRSIKEQMQAVFGRDRVRCAKKLDREDGIEAVRAIFGLCWFDRENCKDGMRALRCYQYEYDKELRTYKRIPLHDWASHPADAFRTLGVCIKQEEKPKQQQSDVSPAYRTYGRGSSGAWME